MRVWGRDFNDFEPIITLSNKNNTDSEPNKIEMKWMIADVMKILPDYTLISGKNISIVDGYKTDINNLAIYGNSEQIKKDSIDFGTANSMTIDTTEDMYLDVDVYGNQYQATREGYNLIDIQNNNRIFMNLASFIKHENYENGILFNYDYDSDYAYHNAYRFAFIYYPFKKNKQYRLSWKTQNLGEIPQSLQYYFPEFEQYLTLNNAFTPQNDTNWIAIFVKNDDFVEGCKVAITDVMLTEGSEIKPYEQYGASPSPDYPSEIETVGSNVNLFDKDNVITRHRLDTEGLNYSDVNYFVSDYIEMKEKTTCVKNTVISAYQAVSYYDKEKKHIKRNTTENPFTTPAGTCYIRICDLLTNLDTLKLEKGSVATPYSPYGMGSVEIDVVNKNFINKNKISKGLMITGTEETTNSKYFSTDYIKVSKNETYYTNEYVPVVAAYDKDKKSIGYIRNTLRRGSFNTGNAVYIRARNSVQLSTEEEIQNAIDKAMIIKGSTSSDYIEHQSQTAIMPIQQEMLEGDYVADVEHHEWGKYVFTGEEDYVKSSNYSDDKYFCGYIDIGLSGLNMKQGSAAYCTHFKRFGIYSNILNEECINITIQFHVRILASHLTENSAEAFKSWLKSQYEAGTPVTIYYKLAKPLNLELTEEQKTVKNTLINAYEPITNVYASDDLPLLKVYTTPIPSPKLPSKINSSGDKKNQLKDLGIINIDYTQGYFEITDTDFILKPDFVYNLSFDYIVNNTTTDLYFTVSYKSNGETFDITNASQYTNKTTGRNNISFIVPADIPANSTLSIKFARTIIQADVSVSVNNIALTKGRFAADYQSPDIYNIYPTATQKNIFNYNDIYYIKNQNATLTFIQNGFSSEVVTTGEKSFFEFGFPNILQPGYKYAISYNSYGAIKSAKVYTMDKETGKTLKQIVTENGVFTAPSNLYDIKAEFVLDDSVADNQVQVWNIQLESGEQVTEAETYTANSIDLTLEQPLRGIGDYRDLACLESPNILNPETQTAIVKGSTTYSLSQSGTTAYKFDYINEDNNIISSENMTSGQFTTPDNCIRIKFDTTSDIITTNKLQVNLGNTAMVYYPYVNEPSIIRQIGEIVLTGNEISWGRGLYEKIYAFYLPKAVTDCIQPIWNKRMLQVCSHFEVGIPGYDTEHIKCFSFNGNYDLLFQYEILTTVEEWKTYLKQQYESGNPVTVDYVLANPTVEQLSSDNILALQNLKTYEGISNVFTNNSMPANLNLSYISGQSKQETKNAYVTLKCWNGNVMPYFIHSNYIDIPKETDKIFIWLRRKNNIFDLKIENLGDYGEDKPGNKGNPQVAITVDDTTTTTITITANTIDTATLSNVKFSKDNGATWDAEIPLDGLSSTDTYTFTGLQPATTYQIRVEATNVNGITGGITQQVITRAS